MELFQIWGISFLGIIIESFPFMLIGAVISSLIQFYTSEELVKKFIPKNKIFGIICAAISGVIFPICECAIVPITRSLIKKGLPLGVAITFMLSVPIINPIVILSTYYAFPQNLEIVIFRVVGGILISIVIGIIIDKIFSKKTNSIFISKEVDSSYCECCIDMNDIYCGKVSKIKILINHVSTEFLNISIYFILGAFLSSIFSTFITTEALNNIKGGQIISLIIMMILAFILSLCSEADAFLAKSLMGNFGTVATIAFLILGPMMDLKNAFLCFGFFKKKFSIVLISVIFIVVFISSIILLFLGIF